MSKDDLRRQYILRRKSIPDHDLKSKNENILKQIQSMKIWSWVKNVHIFLSSDMLHEVDTLPILKFLWSKKISTVVPRLRKGEMEMDHIIYKQNTSLKSNGFGIHEPVEGEHFHGKVDVIFIPLLVFDQKGYRIGYGKGYYDYFLGSCDQNIVKIGLSFFPPIEQIPQVEAYDIPMDYCITPDRIYSF